MVGLARHRGRRFEAVAWIVFVAVPLTGAMAAESQPSVRELAARLDAVTRSGENRAERDRLIREITRHGTSARPAVSALVRARRADPSTATCILVGRALWRITDNHRPLVAACRTGLESNEPALIARAAGQLGDLGSLAESEASRLFLHIRHPDPVVRIQVAEALAKIVPTKDLAAATLGREIDHNSGQLRVQAVYAAEAVRGERRRFVVGPLERAITDRDARVRAAAVIVLAGLEEEGPLPEPVPANPAARPAPRPLPTPVRVTRNELVPPTVHPPKPIPSAPARDRWAHRPPTVRRVDLENRFEQPMRRAEPAPAAVVQRPVRPATPPASRAVPNRVRPPAPAVATIFEEPVRPVVPRPAAPTVTARPVPVVRQPARLEPVVVDPAPVIVEPVVVEPPAVQPPAVVVKPAPVDVPVRVVEPAPVVTFEPPPEQVEPTPVVAVPSSAPEPPARIAVLDDAPKPKPEPAPEPTTDPVPPLAPEEPEFSVEKVASPTPYRPTPLSAVGLDITVRDEELRVFARERFEESAGHSFADDGFQLHALGTCRPWILTTCYWEASGARHQPLYFENPTSERLGLTYGKFTQPVVEAARFYGSVAILPYMLGAMPHCERQYVLGHYRPGDCTPCVYQGTIRRGTHDKKTTKATIRGALYQAGAVTGLIYIVP